MKSLTESKPKREIETIRTNLYASLPSSIREVLENPYKCEKCGKRFKAMCHVREHKIQVHAY